MRDLRSSGQADLMADITGPLDNPVFSGQASIAGGRIRHFSLPHALEAVNGRLTFDASGVRLDEVTARLGGGLVRFGGRIALSGYRPGEFNLTATGEDMRLRYPEGFRSVVDADLSLRGPFETPVLGGTVTVKSSVWSRRVEASGNFLEFVGRATPAGADARRRARSRCASTCGSSRRRRCASTTTSRASSRAPTWCCAAPTTSRWCSAAPRSSAAR